MIGWLVLANLGLVVVGCVALAVLSRLRRPVPFDVYRRMVASAVFMVGFGLWGVIVGAAFWIAS